MSSLRSTHAHLITILITIVASLMLAANAAADAPVEQAYVAPNQIPAAVLEDCTGALTIFDMYGDSEAFYAQEMWKQSWWLAGREATRYRRTGEGFVKDGRLGFASMVAMSGWDFDAQALRRFPVAETDGDHLLVIYDVRRDLRAWLSRSELLRLPGLPGGIERLRETSLDDRPVERAGVDLFVLLTSEDGRAPGRRIYARPQAGAPVRVVRPTSEILLDGNTTITEIRDGFARIVLADPCGGSPDVELGWVRIRDDQGLLKIWCWTGLSC